MASIGEKIYNLLLEQGRNPVDFLRQISKSFSQFDVEEHDIDHKFGLDQIEINNSPSDIGAIQFDYSIELNDGLECRLFFVHKNIVYTKCGIRVGYCNDWVDEDLEIPEQYKNTENIVLHPMTKKKLYEYFLSSSSQPFHDLQTDILYREFKYDYGLDNLIQISSARVKESSVNI